MDEAVRQLVRQRAHDRCEYCRLPQAGAPFVRFHVEHIRARQHGGGDAPGNLALACPRCNAYKGPNLSAVDAANDETVPLFNPRVDHWDDHFTLVGAIITGRTAIGRATAALLDMNAEERIKLRCELLDHGEW